MAAILHWDKQGDTILDGATSLTISVTDLLLVLPAKLTHPLQALMMSLTRTRQLTHVVQRNLHLSSIFAHPAGPALNHRMHTTDDKGQDGKSHIVHSTVGLRDKICLFTYHHLGPSHQYRYHHHPQGPRLHRLHPGNRRTSDAAANCPDCNHMQAAQCCATMKHVRAGSLATCLRISKQQEPHIQLGITKELRMAGSLCALLRVIKQVLLAAKRRRAVASASASSSSRALGG